MATAALLSHVDLDELTHDAMRRQVRSPDFAQWRAETVRLGGCTHPIHLSGRSLIQDTATGAVLKATTGRIAVACGNRRESVCPACSDRYAADAFHLLKAGLSGGERGIPASVADKPRLFVTLTAPSFGSVHNRPTRAGKTLPCRCGTYHHPADPRLGQPITPDAYDYTGHVLWQAHAGALWHRFTIALSRHLARAAGLPVRAFGHHARVAFAKVAEFQKRGIIHFHAVLRLDGPDGAADATPSWGTTEVFADAVRDAARAVTITSPKVDGRTWQLAFGEQIDIRPIRPVHAHQVEDDRGVISDDRVASYVGKYATKGTGTSEAADRPIRSQAHIDRLSISEHHRRIIQTAWDLAALVPCPACHPDGEHRPDGCHCTAARYCATCGNGGLVTRTTRLHYLRPDTADKPDPIDALNLRRWAHMLAFRGHFLTKSRYYSVAFRDIRDDRRRYQHEATLADLGVTDEAVTVINDWAMTSVGHRTPEHRELAAAIAEAQRQARKHRYINERGS